MEFYGLLGEKLSHSLSPEIHNEILKQINIAGGYKLFEVNKDRLSDFAEALKLLKIKGCNVTIPYKKDIMKYVDFISDEAKKIGAINTISLNEGKLYGYNTDYFGFGYMLKVNNIEVNDKVVVILGNGGASRAVLHYLIDNNAKEVYIVSRNPKKDDFLLENVKLISYEELKSLKGDILINSTPVGMYPNIEESPVSKEVINNFDVLVDLIYNPMETKFLSYGKELNKINVGGLYMLIGQAAKAQEIWQDTDINEYVIEEIYNKINRKFL
ncbi:shikimate dehydrogenase [Clostridium sp.]|uniref:shikimate dehydrogenase n=1 Tax=Clostridium sp. TaxID=1506 RepID=UPI00290E37AE|nr:shikimate dehydrogenase [Clostridium sp.]MDU5106996.1 shikimate dehydrogenase [Clostridium sp.]